jgi:Tfp pilus assembly protein PilN
MALHLNLYHEIHKQSERERRDPFKIAGLVALLVAIVLVLGYFYRYSTVSSLERKRRELNAAWSQLEPEMKAAETNKEVLLARQKSNQVLMDRLQGRFYWAPFLEKFAAATPPNVQIVTLTGEVEDEKDNKKTVSVLMKGVAAGEQPRTAAEAFRRSLQEKLGAVYGEVTAVFDANSLEDGAETVQFNGKMLGTATFRIRVQFTAASSAAGGTPKP